MTVATSRTARDVLAWSRNSVDPTLRAAVATLPISLRRTVEHHFEGGGKALRPALTLLAAEAVGGSAEQALPAAAAVELAHNHSLVHDDVMDGDTTRRHRPTVWAVFGVNPAIQAGDSLLALAFDTLARSEHPATVSGVRMLNTAMLALMDGQMADLALEDSTGADMSACVRMAKAKTGALMACACAIGALFGGGRPEQVEHLRAFGEDIGVAFQHVDDLLGIWGDPAVTGKPVHTDLHRRKKSLPVVAAMTSGTAAGGELTTLYRRDEPLSGNDVRHVADLIDEAGGRAWSLRQVDILLAGAQEHLRSACPGGKAADELFALAQLATHRDH